MQALVNSWVLYCQDFYFPIIYLFSIAVTDYFMGQRPFDLDTKKEH